MPMFYHTDVSNSASGLTEVKFELRSATPSSNITMAISEGAISSATISLGSAGLAALPNTNYNTFQGAIDMIHVCALLPYEEGWFGGVKSRFLDTFVNVTIHSNSFLVTANLKASYND